MTVKEQVLLALESAKGEPVSGEKLAGEIGCTRAAVWKAIRALQAEGHEIDGVNRLGYTLRRSADVPTFLCARLRDSNRLPLPSDAQSWKFSTFPEDSVGMMVYSILPLHEPGFVSRMQSPSFPPVTRYSMRSKLKPMIVTDWCLCHPLETFEKSGMWTFCSSQQLISTIGWLCAPPAYL
ncbi:MAG: biotin operon repressor [Clostridia bacterium]|nr:biotin operon repressor [Clostridia bacterium]